MSDVEHAVIEVELGKDNKLDVRGLLLMCLFLIPVGAGVFLSAIFNTDDRGLLDRAVGFVMAWSRRGEFRCFETHLLPW